MENVTLIATATMGLEALVKREVQQLGYEKIKVDNGKVTFVANIEAIPRANIWLRTADRVKLVVGEFEAYTFQELFEKTKALPWADYLPVDAEFPVIGKSVKSKLFSVSDCQAIVKKAIVESLKQTYKRDWFDEDGPLYRIEVALHKDVATLSIDTSGDGLHRRGYRAFHNQAPLKETLAAALVMLTTWNPERPFVDPFCGSGTIPIEAAMIGKNIAPGFHRSFASEQWHWIGKERWDLAREEARDVARWEQPLDILGTDIDHRCVELSKHNATEARLADAITFKQMQVKDFRSKKEYGILVGNPPYGERIGEKEKVKEIYRDLGKLFQLHETWSFYILTANERFEKWFGKRASKKRKLYNGNIKTDYYQFFGPRPPKR